jgi:subfamily B ATP-binding cassette protein MsbA
MTGVNLYSRLLRYVRPYRWAFGLAVLGMMVVAAGDLMLAWLVIPIVRNFETPDPLATKWLPLAIVGVFLLRGVGAYISEFGMGWTGYRVVFDLRRDLIDKLLKLPTP